MFIACSDCALRRKVLFRPFSDEELAFVSRLKSDHRLVPVREHIVTAGEPVGPVYTLYEGWAFRYKSLANGARQILDFLLPGDLIGPQGSLNGRIRHSVCTVTPVSVCVLSGQPFEAVFQQQPALAAALAGKILLDEERADERLLLLGRQRPTQRLAYLMLETRDRLRAREMGDKHGCDFPLTYDQMADALGLSRSQLARSLSELRERGWATLTAGHLQIGDAERMAAFCAYDGAPDGPQRRALI